MARTAACVRSETPSLRIMRSTWTFAVPLLITRVCGICWLVYPEASSCRISASRGVSGSRSGLRGFEYGLAHKHWHLPGGRFSLRLGCDRDRTRCPKGGS